MGKLLSEMTLGEVHVETDVIHQHLLAVAQGRNALLFAAALGRIVGETVNDVEGFMETFFANAARYAQCTCGECVTHH